MKFRNNQLSHNKSAFWRPLTCSAISVIASVVGLAATEPKTSTVPNSLSALFDGDFQFTSDPVDFLNWSPVDKLINVSIHGRSADSVGVSESTLSESELITIEQATRIVFDTYKIAVVAPAARQKFQDDLNQECYLLIRSGIAARKKEYEERLQRSLAEIEKLKTEPKKALTETEMASIQAQQQAEIAERRERNRLEMISSIEAYNVRFGTHYVSDGATLLRVDEVPKTKLDGNGESGIQSPVKK